ncbi:hypothetical protein [Azospirillum sp.]|uniref:hypothetical protein n=1 Tax=Azospirillum sp. TaxID=34012 RepID=UPI002D31E67D|nr:hypothetical protein [Azospirillum sp.]HYD66714.1 hypothetical protein [Azospirillum sp.]
MPIRPQPRPAPYEADGFFPGEELSEADLTPEELESIRASEEDIAAGRTYSNEDFAAIFGPLAEKITAGTVTPADFEAVEAMLRRR